MQFFFLKKLIFGIIHFIHHWKVSWDFYFKIKMKIEQMANFDFCPNTEF